MSTYPVGYTILNTHDLSRGRPVIIDTWYPATQTARETPHDYGLGRGQVAERAPPATGVLLPVIVLSHGAFGSARNYSWIGQYLAGNGYIVAGVSHFGESPVYGPETVDPASALQPWLRPQDCTFALDYLLGQSEFRQIADSSRIGALGHSSGGATVIALGGAVFDPIAMQQYCRSDSTESDRGCGYARGAEPARPGETVVRGPCRDKRIRAIVALDPALGPGYDAASLSPVSVPVHIIAAVKNDFLPFEHHAGRYASLIPGAFLTRLDHGEGHFIFLDVCHSGLEANTVALCKDRPGIHRAEVHRRLMVIIRNFFDRYLITS
jgi:predicted dienelactone hydrolase